MDKISDLTERLERVKLLREMELEPDALSLSLWAFEDEMASQDKIGVAALAAETDENGRRILTLEEAKRIVESFKKDAAERRVCAFRSGMKV